MKTEQPKRKVYGRELPSGHAWRNHFGGTKVLPSHFIDLLVLVDQDDAITYRPDLGSLIAINASKLTT